MRNVRVAAALGADGASEGRSSTDHSCVRLAGRVVSRREMGKKIIFLTIGARQRGAHRKPTEGATAPRGAREADERVEALVDLSRWRGPGDFFVEANLLRAETEVEIEGVCGLSERRGEPLIFCSSARMTRAKPHWEYIQGLFKEYTEGSLAGERVARSLEMQEEAIKTILTLPPKVIKRQAARIGGVLQCTRDSGRLRPPRLSPEQHQELAESWALRAAFPITALGRQRDLECDDEGARARERKGAGARAEEGGGEAEGRCSHGDVLEEQELEAEEEQLEVIVSLPSALDEMDEAAAEQAEQARRKAYAHGKKQPQIRCVRAPAPVVAACLCWHALACVRGPGQGVVLGVVRMCAFLPNTALTQVLFFCSWSGSGQCRGLSVGDEGWDVQVVCASASIPHGLLSCRRGVWVCGCVDAVACSLYLSILPIPPFSRPPTSALFHSLALSPRASTLTHGPRGSGFRFRV